MRLQHKEIEDTKDYMFHNMMENNSQISKLRTLMFKSWMHTKILNKSKQRFIKEEIPRKLSKMSYMIKYKGNHSKSPNNKSQESSSHKISFLNWIYLHKNNKVII